MFDMSELKRFCMFNLIGSMIIAALVAVITVLIGNFNETSWRVIFTLVMVVVHSLIALGFIRTHERDETIGELKIFGNVLFLLVVASFLLSIFGIWDLLSGQHVWDTYQLFFIILFAVLHGEVLAIALNKESYLNNIIYANYITMAIVVLMLGPIVYIENASRVLGDFYFRIVGAAGIVDGTLSMLTIIFYKMYLHNHPKETSALEAARNPNAPKNQRSGLRWWVWLLIIYLIVQVFLPLLFWSSRLF